MTTRAIPEDFPRDPGLGAVPGIQPKLLLRKVSDTFVSGPTEEELARRYDVCADLVTQLIPYARQKLEANPDLSCEALERRLAAAVRAKPWSFTEPEINWMVRCTCEGL